MADALGVEALLEQALADLHRRFILAHHHGNDMRRGGGSRDPVTGQPLAQTGGIALEREATPGLPGHQGQGGAGRGDLGRRQGT